MSCKTRYSVFLNILLWGALWGIFEATVGSILHSVSFGYTWLVWYPAACFFMGSAYRNTGTVSSIIFVGLLCASVKMLNLLLPGRVDKVISPAISIVFEALAMATFVSANHVFKNRKIPIRKLLTAISMNTVWRLLFVLYLLVLVPDWMRNISVISSPEKFFSFFITQNLITSAVIFAGYQFKSVILKPVEILERKLSLSVASVPKRTASILKTSIALFMLFANIDLQFTLS